MKYLSIPSSLYLGTLKLSKMDLKETPEKDDSSTETTTDNKSLTVSTQCKACKKDFTQSTILKHITHKPSCKIVYNQKEIQLHQQWSKE